MTQASEILSLRCTGGILHAVSAGSGIITVICAHGDGVTASSDEFAGILLPLSQRFPCRVVAVDMPGYGKSTGDRAMWRRHGASILREIAGALKANYVVVLADSVGARNALEFANMYPTMVKGLILLNPVPPTAECLRIKQRCMLVWAQDDPSHLYNGPRGAKYFQKQLQGCMGLLTFSLKKQSRREYLQTDEFLENAAQLLQLSCGKVGGPPKPS